MQIILLLLLSTLTFAQKNGNSAIQCDPVEAEKQCFNLLCTQTPKKLIPNQQNELIEAINSFDYDLHPDVLKGFDSLAQMGESIKETTRKALQDGKENKIAEDFLKSPIEAMALMDVLFDGELKCIYSDGNCILVANNLTSYPPELQQVFRSLSESTFVFRQGATLSMKDKKKHLLRALEKLAPSKSKDFMKQERRKISRLKMNVDYLLYTMDSPWFADYIKVVENENLRFKNTLAAALKEKMSQMIGLDVSSEEAKGKVHRSCKIASFIKTTIDKNVDAQKFQNQKAKIIENFRTKFLPRLSEKSGRELMEILSSDPFHLINYNGSFLPFSPNLSVHREGYVTPGNNFDMIRDLTLLNQSKTYRCNLGGLLISDSFNFGTGQISVSQFALANGYGDAMTHELGHWLSAQIKHKNMSGSSRSKLLRARKCVKGNYPDEKNDSSFHLRHKGDRYRTEEDFADWFAAKSGVGENGLFCDLKKLTINLGGAGTENAYLPHAGDPHSNYLFREINIRMNRGETLPQSCKDLMEVYPEAAPKKCDI